MKKNRSSLTVAALTIVGALCSAGPVAAQGAAPVAGGTSTVEARITESTRLAMGWSVKKTLLGKSVYNDAGQKVGKVDDLIISPDRAVSYVIVGAGGFVGIGRHDVAIPVSSIEDKAGRLVMAGATRDTIKAMPEFSYAPDTAGRDAFVAAADKDITRGRAAVAGLERKAGAAGTEAKTRDKAKIQACLVANAEKVSAPCRENLKAAQAAKAGK